MQQAWQTDVAPWSDDEVARGPAFKVPRGSKVLLLRGDVALVDSQSLQVPNVHGLLDGSVTLLVITPDEDAGPHAAAAPADDRLLVDRIGRRVCWHGSALALTSQEFVLMDTITSPVGKAYSYQELVAAVWGTDYRGYADSLRSAIKRLRRKLQSAAVPIAIDAVRGFGYRIDAQRTPIEVAGV